MRRRGFFISLEGTACSGKSSLVAKLASLLTAAGKDVMEVEEFSSRYLDGYLLSLLNNEDTLIKLDKQIPTPIALAFVLAGECAFTYEAQIRAALEKDRIVLSERYTDSLYGYETPLLCARYPGMEITDVFRWLDDCLRLLPKPELSIYLTAPQEVLVSRRAARGRHTSREETLFLREVERCYDLQWHRERNRIVKFNNIDDIETAASHLLKVVLDRLEGAVRR